MARPYGPLLYVEVLQIGLIPQDFDAIVREAELKKAKDYELRCLEFLHYVKARSATRERRFARIEEDYFDAAFLLARVGPSHKKFGCPHARSRADCAILKGAGVMGSQSGGLLHGVY